MKMRAPLAEVSRFDDSFTKLVNLHVLKNDKLLNIATGELQNSPIRILFILSVSVILLFLLSVSVILLFILSVSMMHSVC